MDIADVELFFPGYSGAVESLKRKFDQHRGMPLTLAGESKYYSTTTATALLALDRIGALRPLERQQYQSLLLHLRSSQVNRGGVRRRKEDEPAWDVQEGASVWNTSVAIWALARTGYRGPQVDQAVNWIIHAYNIENGFSPLRHDVNLFIAACAAQGLRLAAQPDLIKDILQTLVSWVRQRAQPVNGTFGWANSVEKSADPPAPPDPTGTLSALWILSDCGDKTLDAHQITGAKAFLRSALRGSHGIWPMTNVYARTPTEDHDAQVVNSYTPSFIIPLLRMGVNPFDPMILEPIRWLRAHAIVNDRRSIVGWDNAEHQSVPLSFTTAYALWAIHDWAKAVARSARGEIEHERTPTVFVVHGHDPLQKRMEIRTHLEQWRHPDALFVMEESSTLDTIFSRVTSAALLCDYAIVLATPDDVVALAGSDRPLESRARQNVIFELGLFLGLYRRHRVSLLTYGEVTLPSDLHGVLRIEMEKPDWSDKLHRALRVAGVIE